MQNLEKRYADPVSFQEYSENDGQEIVTSVLVDATASEAFDAWLKHVWLDYKQHTPPPSWRNFEYLGYKDLAPGIGRGLAGHTHKVPLGIVEQIVSAGEPSANDEQLIPLICYKLRKFGPFAIKGHIGLVRFVADDASGRRSCSGQLRSRRRRWEMCCCAEA